MNKFGKQWDTLAYPDTRAYFRDIEGYRAYYKFYNVSPVLLFQLLDFEKEKNGKLRKRINEQKQKIKSLENKLKTRG